MNTFFSLYLKNSQSNIAMQLTILQYNNDNIIILLYSIKILFYSIKMLWELQVDAQPLSNLKKLES